MLNGMKQAALIEAGWLPGNQGCTVGVRPSGQVTPPRELKGFPLGYIQSAYAAEWRSLKCSWDSHLLRLLAQKAH